MMLMGPQLMIQLFVDTTRFYHLLLLYSYIGHKVYCYRMPLLSFTQAAGGGIMYSYTTIIDYTYRPHEPW